jgi:tripartite-type tricarboxylate transporter receptor subunit TctC
MNEEVDTMIRRRQLVICAALSAGISLLSGSASTAQDWPTRPLSLIYPFAAGSAGDVPGRLLAARLSEALGQPVLFENVGGAGGVTGANRVAKASPDGYQVLLGSSGTNAMSDSLHRKPLYRAATDFAPIAQPVVLIARKDLPAANLAEFIGYAKANQAKMQYGSAGVGSAPQLACELFNAAIGVKITHVPYRGGGAAMQDLIAGRIDYQCVIANVATPQIEAGTIKAIAVLTKDRTPVLPNVPSAQEQGLAGVDVNVWYALFAPKGTPAAVVRKLHDAAVAAMETPSMQKALKDIGATVVAPERRSPEYLRRFVESEVKTWATVIRSANIDLD